MSYKVTVTESIFIRRSREAVWAYTQDYGRRREWDLSILEAVVVLSPGPLPRVRIRAVGGLKAIFQYHRFERPAQTSAAMEQTESFLIAGGGGAWTYEARGDGTLWTQTNTLIIRPGWWRRVLVPLIRWRLRSSTVRAMENAKANLEWAGLGLPPTLAG